MEEKFELRMDELNGENEYKFICLNHDDELLRLCDVEFLVDKRNVKRTGKKPLVEKFVCMRLSCKWCGLSIKKEVVNSRLGNLI
jgi:hypothetical protein